MKAILAAGLVSVICFGAMPETARAAGYHGGHHSSHHGGHYGHGGHGGIHLHGRGVSAGYYSPSYFPSTTVYAPTTLYAPSPVYAPAYPTYGVPRVHVHGHFGNGHHSGHGHHGGHGHGGHGHH